MTDDPQKPQAPQKTDDRQTGVPHDRRATAANGRETAASTPTDQANISADDDAGAQVVGKKKPSAQISEREARLAEALRANLRRRKQ